MGKPWAAYKNFLDPTKKLNFSEREKREKTNFIQLIKSGFKWIFNTFKSSPLKLIPSGVATVRTTAQEEKQDKNSVFLIFGVFGVLQFGNGVASWFFVGNTNNLFKNRNGVEK